MLEERRYQKDAVDGIRWAISQGAKAIMLVAPPGSGKTKIVSDFMAEESGRVMAFSHRKEIRDQIKQSFELHGVKSFDVISTCSRSIDFKEVEISEFVFIDECHHAPAKTFDAVFQRARGIIIGATATPYRTDGEKLKDFFDAVVFTPSVADLSLHGFLSSVDTFEVSNVDFDKIKKNAKKELQKGDTYRNVRIVVQAGDVGREWDRLAKGNQAIIFCVTVKHCHEVKKELTEQGKNVVVVTSSTPPRARERALADFENGKIDGIINCEVFTEGTDIKNVSTVILLRPTMSRALLKQMIGRGFRNDVPLTIIDHVGNLSKHPGVMNEATEDCLDMFESMKWRHGSDRVKGVGDTVLFIEKVKNGIFEKTLRIPRTILERRNVVFTQAC